MSQEAFSAAFALKFRDLMLQILGRELEITRKVLAAIPDEQRDYRPDPKSRSAWELAWHIAADVWFFEGIAARAFEVNPDQVHENPTRNSKELAEWYSERLRRAFSNISAMPGDALVEPIALGGVAQESAQKFPAFLYLLWAHNHIVHHRGQLSAYLRSMGGQVPSMYGPSADEPAPM